MWSPPSNPAGRIEYVALLVFPKNRLWAPMIPDSVEDLRPGSCQHSMVDFPLAAETVVRFKLEDALVEVV